METGIQRFSYLWEDQTGRYVLIQSVPGSLSHETCVVYDCESRTGLLIEDDDVAVEVTKRLADKGVPILAAIPQ